MTPGAQKCMSMKIEGGGTLEVVLGQFWNSLENSAISIQTVFHGLAPSNAAPCLTAGDRVCRIDATVGAALRAEILGPSASLTHASSSARPTKATIRPLSATRDVLPSPSGGQIYALLAGLSKRRTDICCRCALRGKSVAVIIAIDGVKKLP